MSIIEQPNISLVTILHNNTEFYPLLQYHWDNLDYPQDKLEWIIIDDSKDNHSNQIPIHENILYLHIDPSEYLDKIEFPKDDQKITWNYFHKMGNLTNGFKRDYAVGMSNHEYIFHLDIDTLYQPKAIQRKLRFLKDNRLECVYCKSMLCYDIYGKELYKTENKIAGYESTLFHTKEFWKKSGFKWEDIQSEAVSFYYNKGSERKMDNYYDTIKLLSIHNLNHYHPVKISLENMNISIPEIIHTIQVKDHPLKGELNDLFYKKKINVLSINSEIIDMVQNEDWDVTSITFEKKEKEKKLIQKIQMLNKTFDICILNTKLPIWNIFSNITFYCIVNESERNIDQMDSILKKNNYLLFHNLYIHKDYLLK
tara:strand:+ start:3166 stop:4269 length:1104 start_codon:yes stop_codon:yes gene_type:complete